MLAEDRKLLLACIGGSVLTYSAFRIAKNFYDNKRNDEWIPVGTVKELVMFPIKSCAPKEVLISTLNFTISVFPVFSLYCGPQGVSFGEVRDRQFLFIEESTGKFHTARTVPKMITIKPDVVDGALTVTIPGGKTCSVNIEDVVKRNDVRKAMRMGHKPGEGLDCGDEISRFCSEYCETPGMRLIMFAPGVSKGRLCVTEDNWFNNPVPKMTIPVMYVDLTPFLISTEASLIDLNSRLQRKVTSRNFRANIVVDQTRAWDEDKWSEVKIGDAHITCVKPCTRCIETTVDPATGIRDAEVQPLKELRDFRLVPEGKLRQAHGDSPIFGVNAGLLKPGYIHKGQTVYAKYKPSAF